MPSKTLDWLHVLDILKTRHERISGSPDLYLELGNPTLAAPEYGSVLALGT